jgi:hypothetical protein
LTVTGGRLNLLGAIEELGVEPAAQVAGRHVFYNDSRFDGNSTAANAADDGAIAPDKEALLSGETAGFENYTSYSRGINGLMIDIAGLPGTPSADDFEFKAGNNDDPSSWTEHAAPTTIAVRLGAGVNGSDRVTLIWPNHDRLNPAGTAVANQWLQVRVKATADTGLAADDVFYFGNAIGETGNALDEAQVDAADEALIRLNGRNAFNLAPIDFAYDINRDGIVSASDQALARLNATSALTALQLFAPVAADAASSASNAAAIDAALAEEVSPNVQSRRRR